MSGATPEKEYVESVSKLDGRVPSGELADKWDKYKSSMKIVNPANKLIIKSPFSFVILWVVDKMSLPESELNILITSL